ncbi:MAG: cytochrome C oxidase subunit IV family protein [Pseudomonadota bacterium]
MTHPLLVGAWFILLVLLSVTVGASFVLKGAASLAVALGIAFAKAGIVYWFFMGLRREGGLVRLAAVLGALWLLILFSLAGLDYLTRG